MEQREEYIRIAIGAPQACGTALIKLLRPVTAKQSLYAKNVVVFSIIPIIMSMAHQLWQDI
jgi:hypothetical protein